MNNKCLVNNHSLEFLLNTHVTKIFINLISNRANFAVRGPTSLLSGSGEGDEKWPVYRKMDRQQPKTPQKIFKKRGPWATFLTWERVPINTEAFTKLCMTIILVSSLSPFWEKNGHMFVKNLNPLHPRMSSLVNIGLVVLE